MASTALACPLCGGESIDAYVPKRSRVGLVVRVCLTCALVHSRKDASLVSPAAVPASSGFLSCDADYSEIRVGKQQMTRDNARIFEKELNATARPRVLDMAAARGHFVTYAVESLHARRVVALEPDAYMADSIQRADGIDVIQRDFRSVHLDESFDVVYSCHTLEHYADPTEHVRFVSEHLAEDGFAVFDVPDLESIGTFPPMDDFFYDRHRLYFTPKSLARTLAAGGLGIVRIERSHSSIKALAVPITPKPVGTHRDDVDKVQGLIARYAVAIDANRARLPKAVETLMDAIDGRRNRVAVGAGRLLDAAVVYGGLDPAHFSVLVDSFISEAAVEAYGLPIVSPETLPRMDDLGIAVFARQASGELRDWAEREHPGSIVVGLSDTLSTIG